MAHGGCLWCGCGVVWCGYFSGSKLAEWVTHSNPEGILRAIPRPENGESRNQNTPTEQQTINALSYPYSFPPSFAVRVQTQSSPVQSLSKRPHHTTPHHTRLFRPRPPPTSYFPRLWFKPSSSKLSRFIPELCLRFIALPPPARSRKNRNKGEEQ